MKLLHLSDLHLGKRLNEYSLIEDQSHILSQIVALVGEEQPEAVLISGDVYDKAIPSAEAVELFDSFLVDLQRTGTQVLVISGNHDSPERLAFGARLMADSGVHISPVYQGKIAPITLRDAYGPVNFYLLPFIKPSTVRRFFPEQEPVTYTDAVAAAISAMGINPTERNVLLAHQFVTGSRVGEGKEVAVGGLDNVDAAVFAPFDYVALGHIHGAQSIESPHIRYCGTPLKYAFSEEGHSKSVTVVELGSKEGESLAPLQIRTLPLTPLRDMVTIRGRYEELTLQSYYQGTNLPESYLRVILTDEEDILNVVSRLRVIYPRLMLVSYDNARTRAQTPLPQLTEVKAASPLDLFDDLYQTVNGKPLDPAQRDYLTDVIAEIWEGNV